ncbi:energy transducer TonB [Acidaminococcus timonensis]|uniref:energy transducer TonB n=1 Tax=Acidaminococcus timonensis TaxID=1871002 RepID=UPI0025E7EB5C|nr:TonB family protein [Acidaminococcus timonensis]
MENRNWKHYFRWSLGLHLVVLTALGLVLQQTMRPDLSTGPIRVKVEGFGPAGAPGAGKSGGSGGTAGAAGSGTSASRPSGAAGAVPGIKEASLSSESALRELLQAPVAPSAAAVSGESTASSGVVSGSVDSSGSDSGTAAVSGSDGSGQGDGQGAGGGNGNGTDSAGNGGDGTSGGGPGGSGSGDGSAQADLSQEAALQGYSKIYPRAARDAGEEGVAVVGVSVSAGGSVTRAWLEQSTGYDRLDRAALKAAYQWSFTPARNAAGEPIAGESRVTVRYQLDE